MKKFMASILTIMMVVAMIPSSSLVGFAETINGESNTNLKTISEENSNNQEEVSSDQTDKEVTEEESSNAVEEETTTEQNDNDVEPLATSTETYEKVTSVTNGNEYVIVYNNQYVLKWNGSSYSAVNLGNTNQKDMITITNEEQGNVLWTINEDSIVNTENNKILKGNASNSVLPTDDSGYNLNNNNNQILTNKTGKKGYLIYNSGWKTSTTSNTKITFYKKSVPQIDLSQPDSYLPESTGGSEKPQWPNQGSVRLGKSATDANFEETGLTRVELAVTGVPVKRGTDVVVVIDNSSSMGSDTTTSKLGQAKQAAKDFVNTILAPNTDGTASNNRVSVVSFNQNSKIISNLKNVSNKDNVLNAINNIPASSGTNYDAGTKMAYDILDAANNATDYNRNQVVLFMSDGAPYSYYNGESVGGFSNTNVANIPVHTISTNIKNNLPAKLYTVGFAIGAESKAEVVLRDRMATEGCYRNAQEGDLSSVFNEIANEIKYAATDAVLTDTVGDDFELVMEPKDGFETTIKIQEYALDASGNRKDNPNDIEIVTFIDANTAKSNRLGDENIISDGKINASNFTYDIQTKTFQWKIGTITSKEIVLSFTEYLTGSMEGSKPAGTYDTNKGNAKVTYTDYRGEDASRDVESPHLPWKSTSINVKYYLVNEDGKPVNSSGTEVNFKNRIQVGTTEVISINKGTDKTINANQYLPKGYELLNSKAYYTVNNIGTSSVSIESSYGNNEDKKSTIVEGETPYTTSTVNFGVIVHSNLVPDSVVLDYGKPVTFNVLSNDGLVDTTLKGVNGTIKEGIELNTESVNVNDENFTNSNSSKFAKIDTTSNGNVTYTLNKYLDEIDRFYYEVEGQTTNVNDNGEEIASNFYKYSSVSVIPATSVYYEDNFGGTDSEGNQIGGIFFNKDTVKTEGTTQTGEAQSSENIGYGNDSSYDDDAQDSNGSSTKINGNGDVVATFTFKGTGFDLVGRTSTDTGKIIVDVYEGTDTSGSDISSELLNTRYNSGTLYQIPVYKYTAPKYGTYTVQILVGNSNVFYLDGIRIYNPIDVTEGTTDAIEAKNAYNKAKESNAKITEIRKNLLKSQDLGSITTGVVYVDTKDDATISDYKNIGPNNEVYLKNKQSIGFKLDNLESVETIQIGAKSPDGISKMVAGSSTSGLTKELKTATDMYYTLYSNDGKDNDYVTIGNDNTTNIVVTNTGDNILSLTNIKITYKDGTNQVSSFIADEEVAKYTRTITIERTEEKINEDSKPSEDESKLDLKISKAQFTKSSVVVKQEATLKVYTTNDVNSIEIKDSKGNVVKPVKTSVTTKKVKGKVIEKIYTINIKPTEKGMATYYIDGVGKDNSKTEKSTIVKINVKSNSLFNKLFPWL